MAIQDTQKLDYVWKKIGFAATKTDTNSNKLAANEAIPSPLLLRGDKVWQQADSIPSTKPSSSAGVVTVYTGATTVECTEDNTATSNRTWKTGSTDWIPPEFGSTYLVNVYVHTAGDAANAESISNKVFITGSGNDDEWFFDYQSGVLHFIGDNLPNGVNFTGKSVYVAGARYTGAFGVGSAGGEDANLGNLTISNVTISTANSGDPLILAPQADSIVTIDTTSGLLLPTGNTSQRPNPVTEGTLRFNNETGKVEVYDGSAWNTVGDTTSVTSDEFDGDGSTTAFTLSATATDDTVFVVVNGTVQEAGVAYTVSGSTLTMAEAPLSGDRIQARTFFTAQSINISTSVIQDADNDTKIQVEESADEDTIRFDIAGSEVANITSSALNITGNITVGNILTDNYLYANGSPFTSSSYSDSDVDAHLNQSNPTSGYVLSWNGSDYAWVAQSGSSQWTTSTNDIYYTTGNVGIGTTTLSYPLTVTSSADVLTRFDGSGKAATGSVEIDILGPQSNGDLNIGIGGDTVNDATNNIDNKGFVASGSTLDGLNLRADNGFVQITAGGITSSDEVARFAASQITHNVATKFSANALFDTGVQEAFDTLTSATGTVTHDCDNGHIFYHTTPSANWTANFTNLGLTAEYGTTLTVVVNQGATAYLPTALQIGGVAQTINWQGGLSPTGTDNGIDVVSFTVLNDGGTYVVLGQMVDFG